MSAPPRRRGGQPTDHATVTARVGAARRLDPEITIRALARLCRVGRPAIRQALARLEEADRWVSESLGAGCGGGS